MNGVIIRDKSTRRFFRTRQQDQSPQTASSAGVFWLDDDESTGGEKALGAMIRNRLSPSEYEIVSVEILVGRTMSIIVAEEVKPIPPTDPNDVPF